MVFFDSRHLIILNACALSGNKAWEFMGFACITCMWRRHNQELKRSKIKPKHVNSHCFLRFTSSYNVKRMCSQWEQSMGIHGFCLHYVHVAKAQSGAENISKSNEKHVNSNGFLRFTSSYHFKRMCSQWEQSMGIHWFCLHSVHVTKA